MADAPILGTFTAPKFKPRPHIRMEVTEETRNASGGTILASYQDMLQRCFNLMHSQNPDSDSRSKRIALPALTITRKAKKTIFSGFTNICKIMNRDTEHVKQYINTEQNTNSSIDGEGNLIISGRLQQHQIEKLITNYIKQYVMCPVCGSMDTKLEKFNRIQFIVCNQCTAQRAVEQIKGGFVAQIKKKK